MGRNRSNESSNEDATLMEREIGWNKAIPSCFGKDTRAIQIITDPDSSNSEMSEELYVCMRIS